jgi:hypothetical protein
MFLIAVFSSVLLGNYLASIQSNFTSLDIDDKKYIVLGNYKNRMIIKEIDPKTKVLNKSFNLYEVNNNFNFTIINNSNQEFFKTSN